MSGADFFRDEDYGEWLEELFVRPPKSGWHATCPLCNGKGWIIETSERTDGK